METNTETPKIVDPARVASIVNERLSPMVFSQFSGELANYRFVKIVYDRQRSDFHIINNKIFNLHAFYIAEKILGLPKTQMESQIDEYNQKFYFDEDRRFFLGTLSLHQGQQGQFYVIETVEVDVMTPTMMLEFYQVVRAALDSQYPLLFKPANHHQEQSLRNAEIQRLPIIHNNELFSSAKYICLNKGKTQGRIRAFATIESYKLNRATILWHDIIVMNRVPDDIPRVAGIINGDHTTPLSHTNVLAAGWQIPNCIQIGIFDQILKEGLDGAWVEMTVPNIGSDVLLTKIERPASADQKPTWAIHKIQIETPVIEHTPIKALDELRSYDRYKYGTKAANLGELFHVLQRGSDKLLGFYRIKRPPRANLLSYIADHLDVTESADLNASAHRFLNQTFRIPAGIAIPFSMQAEFLDSSATLQQEIGKLKMALELGAAQAESLCISIQQRIRNLRMSERMAQVIDSAISKHMAGTTSFVIRSSSNAEDLLGFSAAGIYESINHVSSAEKIFESIKEVWASLLSPRVVKLRQEVGINLDDSYMGVIIQEEIPSRMGGVLVTTNPFNQADFRNVYVNLSAHSVIEIVQGTDNPYQFLYNVVEGGGMTLSLGDSGNPLPDDDIESLQKLSIAGRLLQSHFSPDYTYKHPVDIEWLLDSDGHIYILQLRPYAG